MKFILLTNPQGEPIIRVAEDIRTVDPLDESYAPSKAKIVYQEDSQPADEVRETVDQIYERLQ